MKETSKNFEELLEKLKLDRTKLAQSDSFDEITQIWKEIKTNYEKCTLELNTIIAQLENSEKEPNKDKQSSIKDLNFSKALNRIEELSQEVKNCSINDLPKFISEMEELKAFCFEKLDQEKVKMDEIS